MDIIAPKTFRVARWLITNRTEELESIPDSDEQARSRVTGTQRLFSVKYLFGEANITQNFL